MLPLVEICLISAEQLYQRICDGCGKSGEYKIWSALCYLSRHHPLLELCRGLLALYGGVLAEIAIGTQLRDSIDLGLTRWRLTVQKDAVVESGAASKHHTRHGRGK